MGLSRGKRDKMPPKFVTCSYCHEFATDQKRDKSATRICHVWECHVFVTYLSWPPVTMVCHAFVMADDCHAFVTNCMIYLQLFVTNLRDKNVTKVVPKFVTFYS